MKAVKSDIISRIRSFLDDKKEFSRKGLSITSGISEQTISSWFNRGSIPSADIVPDIAEYIGMSINWLLTGTEAGGEISSEETTLLEKFRQLTDETDRFEVMSMIETKLLKYRPAAQKWEAGKVG